MIYRHSVLTDSQIDDSVASITRKVVHTRQQSSTAFTGHDLSSSL